MEKLQTTKETAGSKIPVKRIVMCQRFYNPEEFSFCEIPNPEKVGVWRVTTETITDVIFDWAAKRKDDGIYYRYKLKFDEIKRAGWTLKSDHEEYKQRKLTFTST